MKQTAYNKPKRFGGKRLALNLLLTVLFALVYFYFALPALNLQDGAFYRFLFLCLVVFILLSIVGSGGLRMEPREVGQYIKRTCKVPLILIAVLLLVVVGGALSSAQFFRAKDYASLLVPEERSFSEDVSEISFDQIPMLDSDSAQMLGSRKLGELSDMVSQFEIATSYAQINYQGRPVRVTYLQYGDFFKWLNNNSAGLPAYLMVDMVTQEASAVRLENGMHYSPSELFFRNLQRHLRLLYPTFLFDDVNFEIDDDGNPWWCASVLTKRIGLFGGSDVKGAVLCNAVTGECTYYDLADVPTWVDRVCTADLIIQQYDYHGTYQGGFWNSLFGQKNVTKTTDGYNYIAMDDDVWVYTGITSVTGDESNIGFILVNERTKESRYYAIPGAEEYSAMSSAAGAVQDLKYSATFPLLLNISGEPTYFMALKDSSQLVKMYAMVNVQQYQIVATGASVVDCETNYQTLLQKGGILSEADVTPLQSSVTGEIADLRSAVIDGTTYYFIQLQGDSLYYQINAASCREAILLNVGDQVTISFSAADGGIADATQLEKS
ncbi:MAG: CvpA family protein [Oscillospiraceae bacterium]|nr:CvpA family protein [Oscillospiraceae bacterium]